MRLDWLADVLRAAGLCVVEQPGWRDLRPGYDLLAVEGVFAHHTASPIGSSLASDVAVATHGNGVAPGPIANLLLDRAGVWHCIAAGRANHAGAGGPWGWLPASPPGQLSAANARTIGIEAVNNGVGELWSAEMLGAYARGVAALLAHIGQGVDRLVMHSEWAPSRKIDPAGPTGGQVLMRPSSLTWVGDSFRALVAAHLSPPPPVPEEDTVPHVIRVSDDLAELVVDGIACTWAPSPEVLAAARAGGIVSGAATVVVERIALEVLELHGPAPDYSAVGPGAPAGRTVPADFARWVP